MLILEYAPYGDLLGYLRKSRGLEDKYYKSPESCQQEVSSYDLLSFAQQISAGMSFLASKKVCDSCLFSSLITRQVALKRSVKTENKKQSWRLSIFILEIPSTAAAIGTASTIHYNLKNHRQPWIQLLTCTDSHYPPQKRQQQLFSSNLTFLFCGIYLKLNRCVLLIFGDILSVNRWINFHVGYWVRWFPISYCKLHRCDKGRNITSSYF